MSTTAPAAYTASENNPPFMILPTHVDGFIDLKTLADIHRFLNQSASEDDLTLAAWVKQNYLYEPIHVDGREIRTTEGFSKLDRAYRRVRSLTNKAQDKWPFFDRTWKSMPSTTVRNNARGEAAPGVSLPGLKNALHDSPMTNEQDARIGEDSPEQSKAGPFGPNESACHLDHGQQTDSCPVPDLPILFSSTKQVHLEGTLEDEKQSCSPHERKFVSQAQSDISPAQTLPTHTDFSLESECRTSVHSEPAENIESEGGQAPSDELTETLIGAALASDALKSSVLPHLAIEGAVQGAGAGKVRGQNGRFMPKAKPVQPKKTRRRVHGGKKYARRSINTGEATVDLEAEASSLTPIEDADKTSVDVPLTLASTDDSNLDLQECLAGENVPAAVNLAPAFITNKMEETSNQSLSEPAHNTLLDDIASQSATLAYTLAAESDPISSNLDRLPPNSSRKNKRKSEVTIPEGPRRKRGRPRLSEQRKLEAETETQQDAAGEDLASPESNTVVEEEVSKMTTRRPTRRSTATNLDSVSPAKFASTKLTPDEQAQHTGALEGETMVDINDDNEIVSRDSPLSAHAADNRPFSRITRTKSHAVNKTPTQPIISTKKDTLNRTKNADLLALGLDKTSSATKRPKRGKLVTLELSRDTSALSKGASKVRGEPVIESTNCALEKSMPATKSQFLNGTTPAASTNGDEAPQSIAKVEYFARVHTSAGVQEVSMATDELVQDVEIMQKYAEWMEKEGVQIPYLNFKSIFGFAKKG